MEKILLRPHIILATALCVFESSPGVWTSISWGTLMESISEGLIQPRDSWKGVSQTVNRVLAWKKLSPIPMVSLAFVQYLDDEERLLRVQMHRLLNGYSACLGIAADIELGLDKEGYRDSRQQEDIERLTRLELFKGAENEAHWLGKAREPIIRPAEKTPNLLGGSSPTDWDEMLENIEASRGELFVDGDELVLRPSGGDATLELHFELARRSDFTVFFEARSDDDQIRREIRLPRISVPVETDAVRSEITNIDFLPLSYYVRGAESGNVTIDFRFDDGGDVRFRSLSVHAAPDTLACEFDRGVVLVNPSLDDVTFDLTELFPGRTNYRRLQTPTSVDHIPSELMPQYEQTLQLNSGENINNPRSVVVPERNALFLVLEDH